MPPGDRPDCGRQRPPTGQAISDVTYLCSRPVAFTRKPPNVSARTTFNRLLCPATFVWMAEALGKNPEAVQAAADAARDEPNARKRAGLLRGHLPWERIAELAQGAR